MKELLFGTAGIPLSTNPRDTVNGIKTVKQLGLGAMELEFVHSVNISKERAPEVKKAKEENEVILTCHAPYYINLNSLETAKMEASKNRIYSAAKILNLCGGWSVCFHPGFYQKIDAKETFDRIKNATIEIEEKLKQDGNKIWLRPETTGKPTAFGSWEELLDFSAGFDQVLPCIDFAHLHARSNGKFNSVAEWNYVMEQVEKKLGKTGLQNMHIHLSGIEYSIKGEKHHLILEKSDFKFRELLGVLKDFKACGVVICESPNIEEDALLLQKTFRK
ncbi:MAG: TIM barrel protein [archaeon]|nr:TIM barrel protein [archaeon]